MVPHILEKKKQSEVDGHARRGLHDEFLHAKAPTIMSILKNARRPVRGSFKNTFAPLSEDVVGVDSDAGIISGNGGGIRMESMHHVNGNSTSSNV